MWGSGLVKMAKNQTTPGVLHGTEVGLRGKTGYVWRCEGMVYTKANARYQRIVLDGDSLHQSRSEVMSLKIQVTLTRTDAGATTKIISDGVEWRKDYASWDDALNDGERQGLINKAESIAAKVLPPGFPLHTTAEIESVNLAHDGFTSGKTSPPQ
jgi:hypothetical protein